jgi:hypothetical protein
VFGDRFSCALRVGVFGCLLKLDSRIGEEGLVGLRGGQLRNLYRGAVGILHDGQ